MKDKVNKPYSIKKLLGYILMIGFITTGSAILISVSSLITFVISVGISLMIIAIIILIVWLIDE